MRLCGSSIIPSDATAARLVRLSHWPSISASPTQLQRNSNECGLLPLPSLQVIDVWEPVTESDVQTPMEVYQELIEDGYNVVRANLLNCCFVELYL